MSTFTLGLPGGRRLEIREQPLGTGGEKAVFASSKGDAVAAFYQAGRSDRSGRRARLEQVLGVLNPTFGATEAEYWRQHFCWPTEMIDDECAIAPEFLQRHRLESPALGFLAPVYPEHFYMTLTTGQRVEKNAKWFSSERPRQLLSGSERGTLLGTLQAATKVARAIARLHQGGLAHGDISNRNALIDPRSGDARVIDIDSLVVPGIRPPSVLGSPGYIAPEVIQRAALPSIETDVHALAVFIYELLLRRHPLAGRKVHSLNPEEDERLAAGERALFIEHPADRSNVPRQAPTQPYTSLGPALAGVIHGAFVTGLHAPGRRPTAAEWEKALYRTFDYLYPEAGGDWTIRTRGVPSVAGPKASSDPLPVAHFYRELVPGRFVYEKHALTIYHHLGLRRWHTMAGYWPGAGADRARQGYFAKENGQWLLVNESENHFQVAGGGSIGPGEVVGIEQGLRLRTSSEPGSRLLVFEFLTS